MKMKSNISKSRKSGNNSISSVSSFTKSKGKHQIDDFSSVASSVNKKLESKGKTSNANVIDDFTSYNDESVKDKGSN